VLELADSLDLESSAARREGSNPSFPTKKCLSLLFAGNNQHLFYSFPDWVLNLNLLYTQIFFDNLEKETTPGKGCHPRNLSRPGKGVHPLIRLDSVSQHGMVKKRALDSVSQHGMVLYKFIPVISN
jgi:hypothetical protein